MAIPSAISQPAWISTQLEEEAGGITRMARRLGDQVVVGRPVAYDLVGMLKEQNEKIPYLIKMEMENFEFWLLRFTCTIHTAADGGLSWLNFGIEMRYTNGTEMNGLRLNPFIDCSPAVGDQPIAYDMYPITINQTASVEEMVEITPSFTFKGVVETSVSFGRAAETIKYDKVYPRITAKDKRTARPFWTLRPGKGGSVTDGIRELDLIIQKRKGTCIEGLVFWEGRGLRWGVLPRNFDKKDMVFYL